MNSTEVIFHHFENEDEKKYMNYVYRLIEKGYKKRFGSMYIHASNKEEVKIIDNQLWTFRQESFIPHSILGDENNSSILIGNDVLPKTNFDVIINLSDLAEDASLKPKKIHEIVLADEQKRSLARRKWKIYKDQQYTIRSHK